MCSHCYKHYINLEATNDYVSLDYLIRYVFSVIYTVLLSTMRKKIYHLKPKIMFNIPIQITERILWKFHRNTTNPDKLLFFVFQLYYDFVLFLNI